jgi:chemotaxis protein methyltransferase CheR
MTKGENEDLFKKFNGYLEKKFGWFVIPSKIENTAFILGKLLMKHGQEKVLQAFSAPVNHDFFSDVDEDVIDLYSVSETYFNREPEVLERLNSLTDSILAKQDKVNILCAASSSGEEVYSISISLLDHFFNDEVSVWGAEINQRLINLAKEGLYTEWSLRTCSHEYKSRYFITEGKKFRLREEYMKNVHFRKYNLLSQNIDYYFNGIRFDLILCRNIFLYLNPSAIDRVIENLEALLNPGGYLITGLAEGAISERLKGKNLDGFRNIFKF